MAQDACGSVLPLTTAIAAATRSSWFPAPPVGPVRRSPLHEEIVQVCLRVEEARRRQDAPEQQRLEVELDRKLEQFILCDAEGHTNPKWLIQILLGMRARAVEDFSNYYQLSDASRRLARNSRERAISLHNSAGAKIRLGEFDKAIGLELRALHLDPSNQGFWAHLAEAYFRSGDNAAVEQILDAVPSMGRLTEGSLWWFCLKHDPVFIEIARVSKACRKLMSTVGLIGPKA